MQRCLKKKNISSIWGSPERFNSLRIEGTVPAPQSEMQEKLTKQDTAPWAVRPACTEGLHHRKTDTDKSFHFVMEPLTV